MQKSEGFQVNLGRWCSCIMVGGRIGSSDLSFIDEDSSEIRVRRHELDDVKRSILK
jgi:hypothetical protein